MKFDQVKTTFARYTHHRVGFPGVALKWTFDGQSHVDPYITVNGVIQKWDWLFPATSKKGIYDADINTEITRFDSMVIARFGGVSSVQG